MLTLPDFPIFIAEFILPSVLGLVYLILDYTPDLEAAVPNEAASDCLIPKRTLGGIFAADLLYLVHPLSLIYLL